MIQQPPSPAPPKTRRVVIALVLLGAALRLYPMLWGSAFYSQDQFALHPDESKIVRYADDFPGSLQTNEDFRYPHLVHHLGSLAWWPVKKLAGWDDDGVFVKWSVRAPAMPETSSMVGQWSYERALLFLRAGLILIFGVGGTLLLLAFTRRAGIPRAAPWVAAAAAIQPWPILTSAIVQTDTAGATLLFLSVFVALGVEQRGKFTVRDSVFSGLAIGAAIAARYTSGVAALAITTVVVVAVLKGRLRLARAAAFLAGTAALSIATFVAFVPGSVYRFDKFRDSLLYEYSSKRVITEFDPAATWDALTLCAPLWILIPTAVGCILTLRRYGSAALVGACLALAAYFAVTYEALAPDYVIPLMPFAALFSGVALMHLAEWSVAGMARVGRVPASVYVLGALILTGATVHQRYAGDTRYRCNEWIRDNIPPGSLGLPRSPRGIRQPTLRSPEGYKYIEIYRSPKWVVIPSRRFEPIYNVYEDPNHYPGYPYDPVERTLGKLTARDFDFHDDVLFQKRERYLYDLVHEVKPSGWRLDNEGQAVRIYRKSPKRRARRSTPK